MQVIAEVHNGLIIMSNIVFVDNNADAYFLTILLELFTSWIHSTEYPSLFFFFFQISGNGVAFGLNDQTTILYLMTVLCSQIQAVMASTLVIVLMFLLNNLTIG